MHKIRCNSALRAPSPARIQFEMQSSGIIAWWGIQSSDVHSSAGSCCLRVPKFGKVDRYVHRVRPEASIYPGSLPFSELPERASRVLSRSEPISQCPDQRDGDFPPLILGRGLTQATILASALAN